MNVNECHKLIDEKYPDPVLKVWTPSKYGMKYRYKPTKAGQRKLEKDSAKENAKFKDAFDKDVAQKKHIHSIIDEIATYPTEVADLFLNTFKWTIDDIVRRHEDYLNARKELLEKYGDIVANHIWELKYLIEKQRYEASWTGNRGHYVTYILDDVDDKIWEDWTGRKYSNFYAEFGKVKDRTELFKDYGNIKNLHDSDDLHQYGENAYQMTIIKMTDTLERILDEIKKMFNDSKPTQCITDASWGKDMHFNGLLTDGTKKVNFLSFGAGGHNIQRFHYRFKITELKH